MIENYVTKPTFRTSFYYLRTLNNDAVSIDKFIEIFIGPKTMISI